MGPGPATGLWSEFPSGFPAAIVSHRAGAHCRGFTWASQKHATIAASRNGFGSARSRVGLGGDIRLPWWWQDAG